MINGELNDFLELAYLGRELWFLYDGKKYFLRPWYEKDCVCLYLYVMEPSNGLYWHCKSNNKRKNVDNFLQTKLFNGKTFWEVEKEIEWVDY